MEESRTATQSFKLILGSSSAARRQIVAEMGYEFTIVTADIDEKNIRRDKPEDLVMALAEAKANAIVPKLQAVNDKIQENGERQTLLIAADTADAILPKLQAEDCRKSIQSSLLITCDQVVVHDGVVREKPSSKGEAYRFLKDYSGGHTATVGSVLVTNLTTGVRKGDWDRVEIYFHEIPEEAISSLIEEGQVLYVAGGLIIEHPMIRPYVKEVVGGYDSVMGLSKALTERLIKEVL